MFYLNNASNIRFATDPCTPNICNSGRCIKSGPLDYDCNCETALGFYGTHCELREYIRWFNYRDKFKIASIVIKLLQSIRRLLKMRQCFSIACSCTIRGSVSRDDCNPSTGQCDCWHGYTGRRCDNCTVGYEKNERGVCSGIENII